MESSRGEVTFENHTFSVLSAAPVICVIQNVHSSRTLIEALTWLRPNLSLAVSTPFVELRQLLLSKSNPNVYNLGLIPTSSLNSQAWLYPTHTQYFVFCNSPIFQLVELIYQVTSGLLSPASIIVIFEHFCTVGLNCGCRTINHEYWGAASS